MLDVRHRIPVVGSGDSDVRSIKSAKYENHYDLRKWEITKKLTRIFEKLQKQVVVVVRLNSL